MDNLLHSHPDIAFKTHCDDQGTPMEGWFIAGMETAYGQITYHLPEKLWPLLNVKETGKNEGYDGHTSDDVLVRLEAMAKVLQTG